jgi:hypothetical protein
MTRCESPARGRVLCHREEAGSSFHHTLAESLWQSLKNKVIHNRCTPR